MLVLNFRLFCFSYIFQFLFTITINAQLHNSWFCLIMYFINKYLEFFKLMFFSFLGCAIAHPNEKEICLQPVAHLNVSVHF